MGIEDPGQGIAMKERRTSSSNTPAGESEKWFCPPYWIDGLGQITGFTMNANDAVDSKNEVFINHGWENMRIGESLSPEKTYQTYVHMQKGDNNSFSGDVYVFDSDKIVAVYQRVAFSGLPRRVLNMVLPDPAAVKTPAPAPSSIPSATKTKEPAALPPAPRIASKTKSMGIEKLKEIIANEIGMSVLEIPDKKELENLGVDSLLALTIAEKICEELGVSVDSSVFLEGGTVQRLSEILDGHSGAVPPALSDSPGAFTPMDSMSTPSTTVPPTPPNVQLQMTDDEQLNTLKMIIAEEIGVEPADLEDDAELADLGLDSLMSLMVTSRLKEALIDVDSDFLLANSTMGAIRTSLSATPSRPLTRESFLTITILDGLDGLSNCLNFSPSSHQ